MRTAQILSVKPIFNAANVNPIVIFVTTIGDVVRNPRQALIDLQNSGRALSINKDLFSQGIEYAPQSAVSAFTEELFNLVGATLSGDITPYKTGDEYTITEGHPALIDPTHPRFGEVKVGDKLKAEKDGIRVEGFLQIPLTESEKLRKAVSRDVASAMLAMFGMGGGIAAPIAVPTIDATTDTAV